MFLKAGVYSKMKFGLAGWRAPMEPKSRQNNML